MPPIYSPFVSPDGPAEEAPVVSNQLSDTVLSSDMINLKVLSLVSGEAAWVAYLDVYCLDTNGSLFDVVLLAALVAFSHLRTLVVSLNEEGRVVAVSEKNEERKSEKEPVNKRKGRSNLTGRRASL